LQDASTAKWGWPQPASRSYRQRSANVNDSGHWPPSSRPSNAGEPIEEDGDLFGATVILAARIAAQAGAGEILIPEPLRHLLAGKEFLFSDRGDFLPKGFDDAVRLYEVRWNES
jgi:class 3 adenylate cyclase